jgi:phosphoribosylglycinamide formyltransferase 1
MGKRIAVLVSGSGTNLQALLDRDDLGGSVVLVASDRADALGLVRGSQAGAETAVVTPSGYPDRSSWDAALAETVARARPHLVVLAGFMRILSEPFVQRFPTINVHPSLLPAFPGAHAVADALAWGAKVTGCTVHFVDEQVDHGPVIAQEAVAVEPDDDEQSLHERIKEVEHRLLPDCVGLFCRDRLEVSGRTVRILT